MFFVGFLFLSVIDCERKAENLAVRIMLAVSMGIIAGQASQFMLGGRLWHLGIYHIVIEEVTFLLLLTILVTITGKDKHSVIIVSVFLLLLTVTDYYVAKFRGSEIVPSDIFALSTALSVAAKYDWKMSNECFFGIVVWIFCIRLYALAVTGRSLFQSKQFRSVMVAAGIFLFMYWKHSGSSIIIKTWGTNGATMNGFFPISVHN